MQLLDKFAAISIVLQLFIMCMFGLFFVDQIRNINANMQSIQMELYMKNHTQSVVTLTTPTPSVSTKSGLTIITPVASRSGSSK